jgi:hypothetical protein
MPEGRIRTWRVKATDETVQKAVESVNIYGDLDRIVEANRTYSHDRESYEGSRVFTHSEILVPAEDVIKYSHDAISGLVWKGEEVAAANMTWPLLCRDVRFIRCKGRQWELPGGKLLYQPLMMDDDGIYCPYWGGCT